MAVASKVISASTIILSVGVALGWRELHDPETSADVYGRLVSLQNSILWLGLPTFALGLWLHRAKAWALLAGIAGGIATFALVMSYIFNCEGYGTEVAACQPKTLYLDPAIWAGVVNFGLSLVLSSTSYDWSPEFLRLGVQDRFGKIELSGPEIERIMSSTQEPAMTDVGMLCMILSLLLCNLCLPWYGESYDNCDVVSYELWRQTTSPENPSGVPTEGCSGGSFIWGIPTWAFNIIVCYCLAVVANTVAFLQWRTCDEEELDLSLVAIQPPESDEELPDPEEVVPDDQSLLESEVRPEAEPMPIGEEGGRWGNITALEVSGVAGLSRNHESREE